MKFTPQGIEILVSSRRRWKKKLKGGRLGIEGDAEEWKEIRFNDRTSGKGRIEKSCRRPRRIGADERKEFGEWECHDLFFHYNGNGVRDGEGWIETDFGCTHRRGISTDHRDRDILPRWSRGIYSTRWKFRNPSRAGFFSRNLSNWIRIFHLLAYVRVCVRVEIRFVLELLFPPLPSRIVPVQVVDSKASRVESCSFDRFVTERKEENNLPE